MKKGLKGPKGPKGGVGFERARDGETFDALRKQRGNRGGVWVQFTEDEVAACTVLLKGKLPAGVSAVLRRVVVAWLVREDKPKETRTKE